MAWRGPRTRNDPRLTNHHWRKVVRPHWIAKAKRDGVLLCARCRKRIDYDGPEYLMTITGRRVQNPRYLIVGHIVSRYDAKRWGWTDEQADAIPNTQPECRHCSNTSGAKSGQRVQQQGMAQRQVLNTSRRW